MRRWGWRLAQGQQPRRMGVETGEDKGCSQEGQPHYAGRDRDKGSQEGYRQQENPIRRPDAEEEGLLDMVMDENFPTPTRQRRQGRAHTPRPVAGLNHSSLFFLPAPSAQPGGAASLLRV